VKDFYVCNDLKVDQDPNRPASGTPIDWHANTVYTWREWNLCMDLLHLL